MRLRDCARTTAAAGGALAVLLTSACGIGSTTEAASDSTLRVVVQAEPTSLSPTYSFFGDARVWGGIFDTLVGYDRQTLAVNDEGLLPTWEQAGPTEWLFDVREGVTFHNGETFDAAAAAFTINELRDDPASILRTYYDVIAEAAPEGDRLRITTTEAYGALPQMLTTAFAMPPEYYTEVGADDFAQKPVGTGPFELVSYTSGQGLEVARYDDYWRGPAELDGISYSWANEASSRYALLAGGDVDLALSIQPQDVESIEKSDDLEVETGPSTMGLTVFLDTTKGPMADVRLREAVAKAIDRDAIVKSIFQGSGALASTTFIGDLLDEPYEVDLAPDPEEAKRLVAEAGAASLVFGYTSGRYQYDTFVGDAVTGMLQDAGFTVRQRAEELGTYREMRTQGAFDIFMQEITPTFTHPDTYVGYFLGAKSALKSCTNDAEYDAFNHAALSAQTAAESEATYRQLEEQVLTEDYCYVPITRTVFSYGMSDRLQGFEVPRTSVPDYYAMSLD